MGRTMSIRALSKQLAKLEDAKRRRDVDERLRWLRVQCEGARMLHAVLVQEGILRPLDSPMSINPGEPGEEWNIDVPTGSPDASDDDLRALFAGFLLCYARQAAPLFSLPDSDGRLLALVRGMTQGRYATIEDVHAAAIEIGRRYGLVDVA
jgi:hypothetical protein